MGVNEMDSLETIHIYHLNDVHSHFHNWPQMSRFIREKTALHQKEGASTFTFDLGDFIDRSHPLTDATKGRANVQLLNEMGVDAVTIGNNEGITMAHKDLEHLYEKAEFDVLVSNLNHLDGRPFAKRSIIYETPYGTKIGVFGVTAPYYQFYKQLDWEVTDPYEAVAEMVEILASKVDILICLSHIGERFDREIAKRHSELTIILGAHTHHLFQHGEYVNESLLGATGKYAEYIGHMKLKVDEHHQVVSRRAGVIRTDQLAVTYQDAQFSEDYMKKGKELLNKPIFHNEFNLSNDLFQTTELDRFFGRALLEYTGADCAMFNSGIFLGSLRRGYVTSEQLHELLPHPINVATVEVEGSFLKYIYEKTKAEDWPKIEVRGLGFRGTLMGKMHFERLYEKADGTIFIGNRRLRRDETYRLATLDMFTFGFFFPELAELPKKYYMPELIRDVFAWYGIQSFGSLSS